MATRWDRLAHGSVDPAACNAELECVSAEGRKARGRGKVYACMQRPMGQVMPGSEDQNSS